MKCAEFPVPIGTTAGYDARGEKGYLRTVQHTNTILVPCSDMVMGDYTFNAKPFDRHVWRMFSKILRVPT